MTFKNLAGRNESIEYNKHISAELKRCSIDVTFWDCGNSEVRTNICGVLGDIQFHRAWTSWMVSGRVPVEMAKRIYEHPVGRTDIRVGGHCGCIAPEHPYVEWREPGTYKKYARMAAADQMFKFKDQFPDMYTKFMTEHVFHDDPASVGAVGTVDSYHIDTELGLYVFVQFLKGEL